MLLVGEVPRVLGQDELGPFASTRSPQRASFYLHRALVRPGPFRCLDSGVQERFKHEACLSSKFLKLRIAGLVGREKAQLRTRRAASLEPSGRLVDSVDAGLRPVFKISCKSDSLHGSC